MPKQVQRGEMNSFLGGLVTEFSPLNSPPNTANDIVNFELNRDGRINRRLGMDFEPGNGFQDTGYPPSQIDSLGFNSFKWETVGGDPLINFIVFQVGNKLFFYNADVVNFSGAGYVSTVTIDQFSPSVNYSIDSVEGRLAVVSGNESIAVILYNQGTFSLSYNRILTRDYWGIQETIDPTCETDPSWRPGWPNYQHKYNLMNQSWGITRSTSIGEIVDPAYWFVVTDRGGTSHPAPVGPMPSNAEQVWTGLQYQSVAVSNVASQQPFERLYRNVFDDALGAKFVTAKGYFIIDALRRGQSRQDAVNRNAQKYPQLVSFPFNFLPDYTPNGPSCVANYSGRFWYGGFSGEVVGGDLRSPNYANYLFFSQLVKSAADIVKCYQDGDPTSRDNSDVVDTDGGFVRVSGAQRIIAIRQLGNALLVFASNGVWIVTGSTIDSGFSATNYKVSQISTFGIVSSNSLVVEGDVAFFWAKDGIYTVARNQLGDFSVESITLKTIQQFYQAIPSVSKENSFGSYDEVNKKLRWIYQTGNTLQVDQQVHELILDTALNAYTHNIISNASDNSIVVKGLFQTRTTYTDNIVTPIVVDGDAVVAGGNPVIVSSDQLVSNVQYVRYLALVAQNGTLKITVSYYWNADWRDWFTHDGVGTDAAAYFNTGPQTVGDSSVQKWIPYIVFSFKKTESDPDAEGVPQFQSSCLFRVQWAFSNALNSNKFSALQQAYRYRKVNYLGYYLMDTGFKVIQSRNKVRGNGRAFDLHVETEPHKDLQLYGWNMYISANNFS